MLATQNIRPGLGSGDIQLRFSLLSWGFVGFAICQALPTQFQQVSEGKKAEGGDKSHKIKDVIKEFRMEGSEDKECHG